MEKILIVGNSSELLNLELGEKINSFDTVIRFNNFSYINNPYKSQVGSKIDVHVVNNARKLHFYTENKKEIPDLKLILCDQNGKRWSKDMKEKYEYIPQNFCKKMNGKFNHQKKMTTGFCTILYYLYHLKYEKLYITNFDLDHKNVKNIFSSNQPIVDAHDFQKEKILLKNLIKEGKLIYLE